MGIGAVKGVAIGDGFESAKRFGSQNNDPMTKDGFATNHAGGILGGISNGQDIVVRIAVKPTPSIEKTQQTRDINGDVVDISVKGRHDPCIVPRIIPVAEAMLALVIIDCLLEQKKYR
jgi:chorismate synthase